MCHHFLRAGPIFFSPLPPAESLFFFPLPLTASIFVEDVPEYTQSQEHSDVKQDATQR